LSSPSRPFTCEISRVACELIGLSTKTLRSIAPSSTRAASCLRPSSAAFITAIAESSFQYTQAALTIGLRTRSRGPRRQRRAILPSSMPTRSGNRAGRAMAFKGATYMQSALEGSWLIPNNLLKLCKLFSRPCLNSLPCGEGLGVGVVVILLGTQANSRYSRHAPASRFVALSSTCHLRRYHRVLTATPTPSPSPQGGGEQTEFAA
jgi:hypothetical protein